MIIVTGTLAYDYIMDFPGKFADHILPEKIHKLNISFHIDDFAKMRGGTAGNVSYTFGLLGTPHILFSVAGLGFEEYKKKFEEIGIDLSHVVYDPTKKISTGFAFTDAADDQIWGFYNGAAENSIHLDVTTIAKPSDLVLVGPISEEVVIHLAKQCITAGIPYMFDPGMTLSKIAPENIALGVTHSRYIVGNDYEIELMRSRVKNWDAITKDKIVITTFGAKGAEIVDNGKKYSIPIAINNGVLDPTGAGDAWRAGFLAGVEKGKDIQISGQMGAVAASFAIEKYGTQEHTYTKEQFLQRYEKSFGETLAF